MLKTELSGRTVVIAGSGGALDLALVKVFVENGAQVALCCKKEELPDTEKLAVFGEKLCVFELNLLDFASIKNTFTMVKEKVGKVDILINNPMGAFVDLDRVPLHEVKLDDFIRLTDEWIKGMMRFAKLCSADMGSRKEGVILNFLSARGMTAVANQSITVAVSAALHGLSRMWGVEMRDYNIRANGIAVGVLEDEPELPCGNAVRFSHANVKRPCSPEEAANTALFLASDAASYITGTVVTVDGGIGAGYARSF